MESRSGRSRFICQTATCNLDLEIVVRRTQDTVKPTSPPYYARVPKESLYLQQVAVHRESWVMRALTHPGSKQVVNFSLWSLMPELPTTFGFNRHVAPGEAEAVLACLQSLGLIDAWQHHITMTYCSADVIEKDAPLEWVDLLLVMLVCGTDNNRRLVECGGRPSACLLWFWTEPLGGRLPFVEFMDFVTKWRDDVCEVLGTDPQRLLGDKHDEIARTIKEEQTEFPDPTVLDISYYYGLGCDSKGLGWGNVCALLALCSSMESYTPTAQLRQTNNPCIITCMHYEIINCIGYFATEKKAEDVHSGHESKKSPRWIHGK
ncbi:hypothetical protein EDD15DRAFT_2201948 [Pisolithus albus]|nr:hypothetical protein EDD15DRAFT_2201948 [Pisolithus albus]